MSLDAVDWREAASILDARGFAPLRPMLTADQCRELAAVYEDDKRFRSRVEMERFRFGAGEYKYFAAPLPGIVQRLRESLYEALAPIANRWIERMDAGPKRLDAGPKRLDAGPERHDAGPERHDAGPERPGLRRPSTYPSTLDEFLARCHLSGQKRPTPLLLRYGAGGYNCLHQDLYGELAFPLQVVFLLSRPDVDFTGGEFLLVEQRPRAQSRGHAIRIEQGAGVVFATSARPVAGTRGDYRVVMRHGVSTVTSGTRMTLGVIFHDAT